MKNSNFQFYEIDKHILNSENKVAELNSESNPSASVEYLSEGEYLDEEDKRKLNDPEIGEEGCKFNKRIFTNYLNSIRAKHNTEKIKWMEDIEKKATEYAKYIEQTNKCTFTYLKSEKFNTIYYQGPERLTERQLLDKWYEPYYHFRINPSLNTKHLDIYSMEMILIDTNKEIGCSKLCCPYNEIYICLVRPKYDTEKDPNINDHIHPNSLLN